MTSLPTRQLGSSELQATVIGLGANNFGGRLDVNQTRAVIDAALEHGITFIDSADVYGRHGSGAPDPHAGASEEQLGEVLKGRREQVVLATKFGGDMGDGYAGNRGSAEYIARAVDASLKRLQTDVIDLYWYHRPDGATPIVETLTGLQALIDAGKVRAIGASNFSAEQLEQAAAVAAEHNLTPFSALQNEYSLLKRGPERDGTLAACEKLNVGFVPYFPLASGLLTGKYTRDGDRPSGARLSDRETLATDAEWDLIEALGRYASARELTLTQVAIGALLAQPAVRSVIAGATKPGQIAGNAAAAEWTPSASDLAALAEILQTTVA